MKASELRTGNLVKVQDKYIDKITLDTFATLKENPEHISVFEGVPLTKEWMEKLGFEILRPLGEEPPNLNTEAFMEESNLRFIMSIFKTWRLHPVMFNSDQALGFIIYGDCTHVHEMQNLMFALTGKELIIKELENEAG